MLPPGGLPACPRCNSHNVLPADAPRSSRYAPDLIVTPYKCHCGHSFYIVKSQPKPVAIGGKQQHS